MLLALAGFMLLTTVVWLVHHVFFNMAMKRLPLMTATMKSSGAGTVPKVSVILPARDEERNIGRCLHTLLAQDYPKLEIIVVDDRSRDRTPEIVREFAERDRRVSLVSNHELPEGWTGKNYAIHVGQDHADGEYLVFIDADTWYHPRAISETVLYALHEQADMVSLIGGYHHGSFWERALEPLIVSLMGLCVRLWKVNESDPSVAFAAGQFILISRAAYERIGGHASVSGHILEDFALARATKQARLRLKVTYAPTLMRVRMYQGFRELSRGWTRIFQGTMCQSPSSVVYGSVEIVVFGLLPWLGLLVGLAGLGLGRNTDGFGTLAVSSGLAVLAQGSLLIRSFPYCRTSRVYILMLFPGILIVLGFWSLALVRLWTTRHVAWRGSLYPVEDGTGSPQSQRLPSGEGKDAGQSKRYALPNPESDGAVESNL